MKSRLALDLRLALRGWSRRPGFVALSLVPLALAMEAVATLLRVTNIKYQ